MNNKNKEKIKLSYSKISKHEDCSFLYHVNYILKIRGGSNMAARRGNICHVVFECLLKSKRKKYTQKILKAKSIETIPSILRLVLKRFKLDDIAEYDNKKNHNFTLTNQMILTGLSLDFYCKGGELEAAEKEFNFENSLYILRGFIDKIAKYPDKRVIFDYKSDQSLWTEDKKNFNIQSLIYSLCEWKQYGIIPYVKFIFLRFEKTPFLEKHYTEEELVGFQDYLEYIAKYLTNFTFDKAVANLAATKGFPEDGSFTKRTMCGQSKFPGDLKKDGKSPKYHCSEKWPYTYNAVYSKDGEYLYGTRESPTLKDGEMTIPLDYKGCYYFNRQNYSDEVNKVEKKNKNQ